MPNDTVELAKKAYAKEYAKEKAKILEALETSRVDKPDPFPESLATNLLYPIKVKSYD